MFESGGFELQLDDRSRVMAISVGDSIFIPAPLLCDSVTYFESYKFRRIIGDIGRAGTAFMVTPSKSAYEVAGLRLLSSHQS